MKLYHLRIRPEGAPAVQRVFEFAARHTLLDVHRVIQSAFGHDDDHLHAFYMSGKHWDAASQISSGEAPGELGRTGRVRLHELRLALQQRFAYVFDFGDEHWYSLEVEALADSDTPPAAPRLLESVGAVPGEPGAASLDASPDVSALLSLTQDLVALFAQGEGKDAPGADDEHERELDEAELDERALDEGDEGFEPDDDEADLDEDDETSPSAFDLPLDDLASAHELARRLAIGLDGDAERFWALERACETDLLSLLADLPAALVEVDRVDDGAELAQRFAFLDPPHFLGERALLLAEAGRHEEALAQLAQNLESRALDAWVEVKAADVYRALGDGERAEVLLRAVLARDVEPQARDGALDRLLDLLEAAGRMAECRALLAAERSRLSLSLEAHSDTEQRLAPKVGRNDPCPCGSGKKHKKCCLA